VTDPMRWPDIVQKCACVCACVWCICRTGGLFSANSAGSSKSAMAGMFTVRRPVRACVGAAGGLDAV